MKRVAFLIICILGFTVSVAKAQVQESGWIASFNTMKLNDKFSIHFDTQLRSTDEIRQFQTMLFRPGLNYHINKKFTLTGGYAFIPNRRTVGGVSGLLGEHRIWEQLLYTQKIKKVAVSHRLRFEQRFIPRPTLVNNKVESNGHDNAYRLRYFIRNIVPLTKQEQFKKGLFVALQNEVFANVGDKRVVNGKFFDQNRAYGAVGYRFSPKLDFEVGYLNQFTQTRTSFVNNNVVQLAVYRKW